MFPVWDYQNPNVTNQDVGKTHIDCEMMIENAAIGVANIFLNE